jgi:preprotein translocase subunit SecG
MTTCSGCLKSSGWSGRISREAGRARRPGVDKGPARSDSLTLPRHEHPPRHLHVHTHPDVSRPYLFGAHAQKAKSDGGMGAAMGGGMAEATFGADTGNVLSKATINAAIVFFVLSFALYLGRIYAGKHAASSGGALPTIAAPLAPAAPNAPPMSRSRPPAPRPRRRRPSPDRLLKSSGRAVAASVGWAPAPGMILASRPALLARGDACAGRRPRTRPIPPRLLDHFRRRSTRSPIYAEFDLRQMPRRGDEHRSSTVASGAPGTNAALSAGLSSIWARAFPRTAS